FPAPETKKRDGRSPSPFQTSIGRILAALSRVDELADALTALVPDLLVEFVTALTGDLLAAHAPDLLVKFVTALAGDLLAAHAPDLLVEFVTALTGDLLAAHATGLLDRDVSLFFRHRFSLLSAGTQVSEAFPSSTSSLTRCPPLCPISS